MINTDRIVPITAVDLISMYGLILLQDSNNSAMAALQADTVDGQFTCGTGIHLAAQPVKSCNFSGASGTLYFVADYDFEGFTKGGNAVTVSGDVVADGRTLYKAVLSSNTVTITKVGF
jgi:hypothetical protein